MKGPPAFSMRILFSPLAYCPLFQGDARMQHPGHRSCGLYNLRSLSPQSCYLLPWPLALLLLSWSRGLPAGHCTLAPSSTGTHKHRFIPHTWLFKNIRGIPSQVSALTFTAAMVMSTTEKPINNISVPHTGPFMSPTLFDLLICKIFYRTTQLSMTDS